MLLTGRPEVDFVGRFVPKAVPNVVQLPGAFGPPGGEQSVASDIHCIHVPWHVPGMFLVPALEYWGAVAICGSLNGRLSKHWELLRFSQRDPESATE